MNETLECSHARYARTILKVVIFLVKSDTECIMHIDTAHGELNQSIVCAVPPEWIVKPQDQEAVEGQDVFFDCRVSGVPEPSIIWRRLAGMTTTLKLFN